MCPFKKAFPLVLFLHLMLGVGIFASFAERSVPRGHLFTLMPAQGEGQELKVGLREALPAHTVAHSIISAAEVPSVQVEETATISKKFVSVPDETPVKKMEDVIAAVAATAGEIAGSTPSAVARIGADMDTTGRTGGRLTPPVAIRKPKPLRPAGSLAGEVVVYFTINTAGRVENISIENSPSAVMTAAVLAVLPQWRFAPAQESGKAIPLRVRQVVKF